MPVCMCVLCECVCVRLNMEGREGGREGFRGVQGGKATLLCIGVGAAASAAQYSTSYHSVSYDSAVLCSVVHSRVHTTHYNTTQHNTIQFSSAFHN